MHAAVHGPQRGELRPHVGSSARRRSIRMSATQARAPYLQREKWDAPAWTAGLPVPAERYSLALLPTPLHRWAMPAGVTLPAGCEIWIKRDDLTGASLSGNKCRKLEFLLARAKDDGADCVVTIGGIGSNHARATAVASRYLGLDSFLILRTENHAAESDPGLTGNLLPERLVGAHVELVTKAEYGRYGSVRLGEGLARRLREAGRRPFVIPVGGSNGLGSWGYVSAMAELQSQALAPGGPGRIDAVVFACGSGGTAAGIALGNKLSGLGARVHAFCVCDDENYFYAFVDGILGEMGVGGRPGFGARDLLTISQAKGAGYAASTQSELELVRQVAESSGVLLDPVYAGKAFHGLLAAMAADPASWEGRRVVFVHTGGGLGLYDKAELLQPMVSATGRATRYDFAGLA